jgi:hypothetical protein
VDENSDAFVSFEESSDLFRWEIEAGSAIYVIN